MTDDVETKLDPNNSVRKAVHVKGPREIAWRVFTEKVGTWWPLVHYNIGKATAVDAILEPRVGGCWYERGEDGGPGETRVELEHRRLDRYGARRDEMRRLFDTEGDWGNLLAMFAAAAAPGGK